MSKLQAIVANNAVTNSCLFGSDRAPVFALGWVLLNLAVGWIALWTGSSNAGAVIGAVDGAILSWIVLPKTSARLEAGLMGLLSWCVTNSPRIVSFVHTVHHDLDGVFNEENVNNEAQHQILEQMFMNAIMLAIAVMLVAVLVKWGRTPAAGSADPPMPTRVSLPAEVASAQAA